MSCKNCGGNLYQIKNLCLDRDGIREAVYCDDCGTVWKTTCAGYSKHKVLKPPYALTEKEQLKSLCEYILKEIK